MVNNMTEKEKKIQRALGTLKKYSVELEVDTQGYAFVYEHVEAISEEDARKIVMEKINSGQKFDWEFRNGRDIDTDAIEIGDITEEV